MGETPSLAELQRQMLGAICGGDAPAVLSEIAGDRRLSAKGRLEIYADMYLLRLTDALRTAFPTVVGVMGDEGFADLAADFLAAHPSRHPSLRDLGARLPQFLRGPSRVRPRSGALPTSPWVADAAALDWARWDVFDDTDASPLLRTALAAIAPDAFGGLRLSLIPASRVVPASCAIERVWRAVKDGAYNGAPPPGEPRRLLVWRQGNVVYHRPLSTDEADALSMVRAGRVFGDVCAAQLGDPAVAAQTVFSWLLRWVDDGVLATWDDRKLDRDLV